MRKEALYVLIIIDVEEEGLFSGQYPQFPTVHNVAALPNLAPFTTECGIPLTLVCAHTVFADVAACAVLENMRTKYAAEIGAHLHYWSTPPHGLEGVVADTGSMKKYVAAKDVHTELMRQKMSALFTAAQNFCGHPVTTFRMGRWDMSRSLWPHLAEHGVCVDSSIRPWHYPKQWRDHFLAPTQPYTVQVNGTNILEVPDTAVPIVPRFALLQKMLHKAPSALLHTWHQSIVMAPNPVYHSLAYMKAAARAMLLRGDRVLTLTWHSSEVMPGATPHLPHKHSVDAMLLRVRNFLTWLATKAPLKGVTLGQLAQEQDLIAPSLSHADLALPGDWHP